MRSGKCKYEPPPCIRVGIYRDPTRPLWACTSLAGGNLASIWQKLQRHLPPAFEEAVPQLEMQILDNSLLLHHRANRPSSHWTSVLVRGHLFLWRNHVQGMFGRCLAWSPSRKEMIVLNIWHNHCEERMILLRIKAAIQWIGIAEESLFSRVPGRGKQINMKASTKIKVKDSSDGQAPTLIKWARFLYWFSQSETNWPQMVQRSSKGSNSSCGTCCCSLAVSVEVWLRVSEELFSWDVSTSLLCKLDKRIRYVFEWSWAWPAVCFGQYWTTLST